jgi:hypothetical protein
VETADSAGTPWAGRDLSATPYAADHGEPDPVLVTALDRLAAGPDAEPDIVAAMAKARLFVAVVAVADEDAAMALVTVTQSDRRRALPVFSSPAALARWRPEARPVPVPGPRAALSAVAEGCDLLDLDPGGPVRYLVRRPAVWALARGLTWTPSYADPVLAQEISAFCAAEGLAGRCERGTGAELRIILTPPTSWTGEDLTEAMERLSQRLAVSERVADGVDSLELTVDRSAGPPSR